MSRGSSGLAMMLAAGVLAGCGSADEVAATAPPEQAAVTTPPPPPPRVLVDAATACGLSSTGNLADEGMSILFDTEGEDDSGGDSYEDVACVLGQLDAPDHVIKHMDSTRALDGMQASSWGDIDARWTFHPDNGLDLTLVDTSQG